MTTELILLCLAAFAAGFIDAIVGGGGLVQTPAGLVLLPLLPVSTVIGTLKIPAFSGTALASLQYMRKIRIEWKLITVMAILALSAAIAGSFFIKQSGQLFHEAAITGYTNTGCAIHLHEKEFWNTYGEKSFL